MSGLNESGLIGGRYRIVGPLGSGNMGDVYRAVHAVTGQKVALKIIKAHVAQGQGAVTRFLREVQAAATIDHPGVVQVFDAGAHENTLYIAMELLEGESLRDRLNRGVTRYEVLLILRRLLDPLAEAHRSGIIHRDLKPDNIFVAGVRDETVVKLLDFGIASDLTHVGATQTGLTVGTPHYMSPEQAIDPRTCTPATDVWAVGVMLYEVLAGKVPFDGITAHGVLIKAIGSPHPELPESVETSLCRLVDACLQKDQRDRPRDAAALALAFDRAVPELDQLTDFTVRAQRPKLDGPSGPTRPPDVLPGGTGGGVASLAKLNELGTGADRWALGDIREDGATPRRGVPKVWLALAAVAVAGLTAFLAMNMGGRGDDPGALAATNGASAPASALASALEGAPASVAPSVAASPAPDAAVAAASAPSSLAMAAPDAAVPDATVPDAAPTSVARAPATKATRAPRTPGTKAPERVAASKAPSAPATEPEAPEPPKVVPSAPASVARLGTAGTALTGTALTGSESGTGDGPDRVPATQPPAPPKKVALSATFGEVQIDGALPRAHAERAMDAVRSSIEGCVSGLEPRVEGAKARIMYTLDSDGFVTESMGTGDPEGVRCGKAAARSFRLTRRPDTGEVRLTLPVVLAVKR